MRIMILGGTGFIGRYLNEYFSRKGHHVIAFGREAFNDNFDLTDRLNRQDILIMLSGANVGERWTTAHKKRLWDSRIETNARLRQALYACNTPPGRIFSASAVGIYPEADCSHPLDESCTKTGSGTLAQLGKDWEAASSQLLPHPVIMRFGVVLGENGGALSKMLPAFKMGLGGPVASGKQCFSWIHLDDLARAIDFLIAHPKIQGPVNLTSPHPVTNAVLGKTLANELNRPFWLPLPQWLLRWIFGEGAQVLTLSSAVYPKKLLDAGFQFQYETLASALKQILTPH